MLQGVIPALITPMDHQGHIDWSAAERYFSWHVAHPCSAYVVAGSTGEGTQCALEEKKRLWQLARSVFSDQTVIAGLSAASTADLIVQAQHAEACQVDVLMLTMPYYCKPSQSGMMTCIRQVLAETTLPVMLYNIPSRTGCHLAADHAVELLQSESQLIGIKDASGSLSDLSTLLRHASSSYVVCAGDDDTAWLAAAGGAQAVISVLANVIPQKMQAWFAAAQGKQPRAVFQGLDAELRPWFQALALGGNPSMIKYLLSRVLDITDSVRSPLEPLSTQKKAIVNALFDPIEMASTC